MAADHGIPQGHDLSMGATGALRVACAQYLAAAIGDDAAHTRVGTAKAQRQFSRVKGALHEHLRLFSHKGRIAVNYEQPVVPVLQDRTRPAGSTMMELERGEVFAITIVPPPKAPLFRRG